MSGRLKDVFTHYVFLPCFKEKRPLESFLERNWTLSPAHKKAPRRGLMGSDKRITYRTNGPSKLPRCRLCGNRA